MTAFDTASQGTFGRAIGRWFRLLLLPLIVWAGGGQQASAAAGCSSASDPTLLTDFRVSGSFPADLAPTLFDSFTVELENAIQRNGGGVSLRSVPDLAAVLWRDDLTLRLGGEVDLGRYSSFYATEFALIVVFAETNGARRAHLRLIGNGVDSGQVLQATDVPLTGGDEALWLAQMRSQGRALASGLCSQLRRLRVKPVVPAFTLALTPQELDGNQTLTATATLIDLDDNLPQPGYSVSMKHRNVSGTESLLTLVNTDFSGQAVRSLVVPPEGGLGSVTAKFERADGKTFVSNQASYRVADARPALVLSAPRAMLPLRGTETVCATLRQGSQPVAGAAIGFGASDGNMGVPGGLTGPNGQACAPYVGPGRNALVEVAAATAPTPIEPAKQAQLSFVIDAGVVFNFTGGASVTGGAAATFTADLSRNGQPLVGVPVSFTLDGPGLLSGNTTQTDAAGRADLVFLPAVSAGAASITATAVVDGQRYERIVSIGITAPPAGKMRAELDALYSWVTFGAQTVSNAGQIMGCLYGVVESLAVFNDPPPACPFPGPNRRPPVSFESTGAVSSGTEGGRIRLDATSNQVVWAYDMIGIGGESFGYSVVWLDFTSNGTLSIEATNPRFSDPGVCAISRAYKATAWPPPATPGATFSDEVAYGTPMPVTAGSRLGFWVVGSEQWFPRRVECPLSAEVRFTFRPAP